MVSTMTMLIQPSSARTRGSARWRVGRSSERNVEKESMRDRRDYDGGVKKEKFEMEMGTATFGKCTRKSSCSTAKVAASCEKRTRPSPRKPKARRKSNGLI